MGALSAAGEYLSVGRPGLERAVEALDLPLVQGQCGLMKRCSVPRAGLSIFRALLT